MENQQNKEYCADCGAECSNIDCFLVDGKRVCHRCLFGDVAPVKIYPIGVVVNGLSRDHSDFGTQGKNQTSEIRLFPSQHRFMHKLDEESHLTVVYFLHQSRSVRSRFRRGWDSKEVGVFASRTPDRLSRIGIQDVRLVQIQGTTLIVEGLDAIDGTPVLDIKMKWPGKPESGREPQD
ncbi:MAG: TrmO family methyltransferase [bacterium]